MLRTCTAIKLSCVLLAWTCLSGCGSSPDTVVSGNVRWNGEPLAYGFISFCAVDGSTKTSGAAIENGKYRAHDVPPGEKIVKVIASDAPRTAQSSADVPTIRPTVVIPPDAKGNGEKHQIGHGTQTLDLSISGNSS